MSIPSTAALSQRLNSLSSLIIERSRVVSLNLTPSSSTDAQITRSLSFVRDGLARIQDEIQIEQGGLNVGIRKSSVAKSGNGTSAADRVLEDLGQRYDRLIEVMEEDDIGRDKVRGLRRSIPSPEAVTDVEIDDESSSETSTARPIPDLQVLPPTPFQAEFGEDDLVVHPAGTVPADDDPLINSGRYTDRRCSYDVEAAEYETSQLNEQQLYADQNELMDEQDARLDLLSNSINRHHHMSIQIGSELELHNQMLDETDERIDGTSARMRRAGRTLDKVANRGKEHMSSITIVLLIVVLLLLIIVFKT